MLMPKTKTTVTYVIEYIKAHTTHWAEYAEYNTEDRAMETFNAMGSYKNKRIVKREVIDYLMVMDQ